MAKIPFGFGVGGGDSSDDCTATASDILESKTAIYNGSDDDAAAGTMKDYSGASTSVSAALNSSSSRVQMTIPNTGKYSTSSVLYTPYSSMASLIGLTATKIASGNTILGIAGTSRVYQLSEYSFTTSTSAHSTESWVNDLGTTKSIRSFTLSDIGLSSISFTPTRILILCGNTCCVAASGGTNIFTNTGNDFGYLYPASSNSKYAFSSSSVYIPFYYTSSNLTASVTIIGYTG